MQVDPGEHVIYSGHPSWRGIMSFYVKGTLISVAAAALVWLGTGLFDDANTGQASLVLAAGVGITVLVGFIKRIATEYVITDQRLHIKRGIIARHTQETQIARAQNVNTHQSPVDRLLQVGTVNFDTAGSGNYDFAFAGVSDPDEVVRAVDRAQRSQPEQPEQPGELAP